jgi:type IV secretory pathway VirJ component
MRRIWLLLRACATSVPLLIGQATVFPLAVWGAEEGGIGDLPLIELPGPRSDPILVLFLSGDGGWRDLDKTIGERLASEGLQVVGFDSLRYFWHARSADEVARDFARAFNHYRSVWGSKRFVLAGYSFGADVLPAALDRMDADLRENVIKVVLLGLSDQASFEIHPMEWLGIRAAGTPILPDARKLDMSRVLCISGREEKVSLCRDPAFAAAERIETAGGHHFDRDYQALASRILASIRRAEGA